MVKRTKEQELYELEISELNTYKNYLTFEIEKMKSDLEIVEKMIKIKTC